MWTDRQTDMTKLFCNFGNSSKNWQLVLNLDRDLVLNVISVCYCRFQVLRWIYLEQKDIDVMTLLNDTLLFDVFVWRWIKYQNNYNWRAVAEVIPVVCLTILSSRPLEEPGKFTKPFLDRLRVKIRTLRSFETVEIAVPTKNNHIPVEFCFLDRAFSIMRTKIIQQNAQINSGLIYYWSITPICFGPSIEAIIREFEILESYKAIVLIC